MADLAVRRFVVILMMRVVVMMMIYVVRHSHPVGMRHFAVTRDCLPGEIRRQEGGKHHGEQQSQGEWDDFSFQHDL